MTDPLPLSAGLHLATTTDRVALARRTHRSMIRTFAVLYGALAAVILFSGLVLVPHLTSAVGVCMVAGVFLLLPVLFGLWVRKTERRAELFLAADGTTVVRANAHGVTVAGVELPYGQITCLYANAGQEVYSDGGLHGEMMAHRLGLGDERPTIGRSIGARLGTGLRRRFHAEGAKSAISVVIGIERKGGLQARPGMVDTVALSPQRGVDPGRIIIPLGAYLGLAELQALLDFVQRQTGGQLFPIGVVSGTLNWASAQMAPSETREKIWEDFAGILGR